MKIDPKPNLGPAAIESNIEYYKNKGNKASEEYRQALEQQTYWMRELEKLKPQTQSGFGVPAGAPSSKQQWSWLK
jgi:hypothetical protein